MKAVAKRELKSYLKNPVLWIGLLFILFELYQSLNPYLKIRYYQSDQELEKLKPGNPLDGDISSGYVKSTKKEQMELMCEQVKKEMAKDIGMTREETGHILNELLQKNMTVEEMSDYLLEKYDYYGKYGLKYYYETYEFHKGDAEEVNAYIGKNLDNHTFSHYFGRKFADFCGLYMGFFSAVLLAFLFIRDTKRDTYELLHTKPISASGYVCGKIAGGFLTMMLAWGILTLLFGGLSSFYGLQSGFPVSFWDFLIPASVYILPNMLMITCIYTVTALVFKNPLPAVPLLFLYMVYSNMGSRGPDGSYGYFGRPLAIMVRFPGDFFDTAPPPLALQNQAFLLCAAVILMILAIGIWKRRRVY